MNMTAEIGELTEKDYERFRRLVYTSSGIELGEHKMQLVRARLGKLVRTGGFASYRDYYVHVEQDRSGEALCTLLDAISTNTTHLFREPQHFDKLREVITAWLADRGWCSANPSLRVWCAASSTGDEPYSLAMTIHDTLKRAPGTDFKLLATDISTQVLAQAKLGLYEPHRLGTVPDEYRRQYFKQVEHEGSPHMQVIPELRRMVTFSRFNLMTPTFPFKRGFHVVFCRNVMIYFDKQTQETLINKIAAHMKPGGYLMIGHAETLNKLNQPLAYVEPTVYQKT